MSLPDIAEVEAKRYCLPHIYQLLRAAHRALLPTIETTFIAKMKLLILPIAAAWLSGAACQDAGAPKFYPCPFVGPRYAKPVSIENDNTLKGALDNITATIEAGLASGSLENQTTAMSLTAFSTSDEQSTPFYSFHHTPPSLAELGLGVETITGDSVYRIGSVSKVITVYALLVANGFKQWQSPITDFLQEIRRDDSSDDTTVATVWEDVTLEALAAHLGGIGVECKSLI